MEIEIGKVEKVIKDNKKKLDEIEIEGEPQCTTEKYNKLYRLFNCFMGDLYKLFGNECLKDAEDPTLEEFIKHVPWYNHE